MRIIHVEKGSEINNSNAYEMFIGRFQTFSEDHRWIVNQLIERGKNVLICVLDVTPDEDNPFTPLQVQEQIKRELWTLIGEQRVKVIIIPNINSINFGRGVEYDIIEHITPININ
jgi:nicotinamide mononucleotide adenylyltransferase